MVGTREVVAGGAAPYRKGFIQLVGQQAPRRSRPSKAVGMDGWRTSLFCNASGKTYRLELIDRVLVVEALPGVQHRPGHLQGAHLRPCRRLEASLALVGRSNRAPVVKFEQQAGGEATGHASCHEQIADPCEQRWRIGGGCQALFEVLQLLHVAAAPQSIDQGVFSWLRLGELGAGHSEIRSFFSAMALATRICQFFDF